MGSISEQTALRLRQAPNALRRATQHPSWFAATVQGHLRRRREDASFTLARYQPYLTDIVAGLAAALRVQPDEVEAAAHASWWPKAARDRQGARPELARVMRAVTRLVQPEVVVETGVAQGVTSAVILRAMHENGHGKLYSVDLPPLGAERGYVGSLIPEDLRDTWMLYEGPSNRHLKRILSSMETIDVFLHDAEHTYKAQLEEYTTVWPHLRAGGVLVSDDVGNMAFAEFAQSVALPPTVIGAPKQRSGVGLLVKPG